MPATLNQALGQEPRKSQNPDEFSRYNVYFALNQYENIPQLEVLGKLYGRIPWQKNMGPTMQGVRVEPTPKTRTQFRPRTLQQRPLKDVHDQRETQERMTVSWHKVRSPLIYFLRSFQDCISNQIDPSMENLNEQMVFNNEMFIQTAMYDRSPFVFRMDASGGSLVSWQNSGPPNYTANPKQTAADGSSLVVQALVEGIVGAPGLTYPMLDNLRLCAKENQRVKPFSGSYYGKDSDLIAGRYVIWTSEEAFSMLKWDPNFQSLRNTSKDYASGKFSGDIYGDLIVKCNDKPWRFGPTGTAIAPEVEDLDTGETIPNPTYADIATAPFELGWFLGGDAYKTVRLGPPPKEFAGGASPNQVNGMDWNGKVRITKNVLIEEADDAGAVQLDTNADGEYLQLRGTQHFGCLPVRARNAIPFVFARRRA